MFRLPLFFLISLPLIEGFGVAGPAFRQSVRLYEIPPWSQLPFSEPEPVKTPEPMEFYAKIEEKEPITVEDIIMEEEPITIEEIIMVEEPITMEDLPAQFQELPSSTDFVNDPNLMELSEKAAEFTKDFFGSIFSSFGDKLKELKEEKDSMTK